MSLAGPAAAGEAPAAGRGYRRVLLRTNVPLADGAPRIAVEGERALFTSGPMMYLVDTRTGELLRSRAVVPSGDKLSRDCVHLLGIVGGKAYAYLEPSARLEEEAQRRTRREVSMTITTGERPEAEPTDIISFGVPQGETRTLLAVPKRAALARRLLGDRLVYTHRGSLHVVPLTGRGGREIALGGENRLRPDVGEGEVFGLCDTFAYLWRPGEWDVRRVPFRGTGLAPLEQGGWAFRTGDLIVALTDEDVRACELDGKLRWKFPAECTLAAASDDIVCVVTGAAEHRGPRVDEGTPHVIFGLSAEDGRILWRRPLVTGWWQPKPRQVKGYSVLDGRLVIYATHMLSVIDVETGRLLMDLPQRREMVRRSWSSSQDVEAKLAVAGNTLLVGFENLIEAVDLTPTADVPRELRAGDPASVGGSNMADTLEEGEKLRGSLPGVLYRTRGGKRVPDRQRIMELYWLDDEAIVEAMLALLRAEELWLRGGEPMIIASFVGHPNEERGIAALRKVVEEPGAYTPQIRRMAKEQLELVGVPEEAEGKRPGPAPAPAAEILYSGDSEKAVIWFRERLLSQDGATRRAALEGLKLAADKVIVALEGELGRMPEEEERAAGGRLVHDAEQRLAAMRRFQTKKMAAGVRPPVPKPDNLDLTGRALVPALPPDEPPPIILVADDDTRLPAGAVCRVGTPGKRPTRPPPPLSGERIREHVTSAALAYDGKTLATSSHLCSRIRLWDLAEGRLLRVLDSGERLQRVRALRFSPNGGILASGNGGVRLWDARTAELVRKLRPKEHAFSVKDVAFSADGTRLAAVGGHGQACVWEVKTGREITSFDYDKCSWHEPVGLGPEGKILMTRGPSPPRSAMRKSPAILWDVETGRKLRTLAEDRVQARFALSPDGTILASQSTQGVELIDSNTGSVLAPRKRLYLPIVFSPDGRMLACTQGGGRIHLLDVATGHAWHVFEGGQKHTTCISFSGDGGFLASAHSDGTAFVWKVPDRPMGTSAAPADD